ncbi:dienelactone hydrolase family protein [Jeongeupia naejangsanensis]|uniref:Prolyl oligopeptidase family serine peptidase n=1 Tax=Jeongeupia naejangsanensis TaxID=613195 RepID=A0ABS2BKI4_9NEIS|nr:CocE/NonD family hydrolase [Jeongeupia naejangsanensis]MBM3116127.1 prolyl oligopeptidase family serine peptidase [Jeongeupia naejangsanensis]
MAAAQDKWLVIAIIITDHFQPLSTGEKFDAARSRCPYNRPPTRPPECCMLPTRFFALLLLFGCITAYAADDDGPPLRKDLNEQVLMLPVKPGIFGFDLETTLFKPDGAGPFPLAVINHGKNSGQTFYQDRQRYTVMTQELLKRGYIVALPMRRSFGKSGGEYRFEGCNLAQDARNQADDVAKVIELLRERPDVDGSHILVMGQSHGGFTSLALAERDIPGMKAVLNFAGGLYYSKDWPGCTWEPSINKAFEALGKDAKVDSLWFYGENDSLFPPRIAQSFFTRYTEAGGKAELVSFPAFRQNAHLMFGTHEGFEKIWWPKAEPFLKAHGLPTMVINPQYVDPPTPKPSGYAEMANVDALPKHISDEARAEYRKVITEQSSPRVFAFNPDGPGFAYLTGYNDAGAAQYYALKMCQSAARKPCQIYLLDDVVVWPTPAATTVDTTTAGRSKTTPES